MGSIRREILIEAPPEQVWDAARDVGALHTRLVPGFVTDTRLEEGARIVTFGNGMVIREPIVDVDDDARRIAWSSAGTSLTHYNASFQVFADGSRTRGVWIADFLPNQAAPQIAGMMEQGLSAMKKAMESDARRG